MTGVRNPGRHVASVTSTTCPGELTPSVVVSVTLVGFTFSGCCPPGGAVTVYVSGTLDRLPPDPLSERFVV
jgi:hypothetical protein